MAYSRTVVDVDYDDYPARDRFRDRKAKEVPWDELDEIRNRELAVVRVPARARSQEPPRDYDSYGDNQAFAGRGRYLNDDYVPQPRRNNQELALPRVQAYRQVAAYNDEIDHSDSAEERRRRRYKHRRARSERGGDGNKDIKREVKQEAEDEDDDLLWYSMKKRRDGNFVERNFDCSYDGIISGAAGAAIGAITAREFGGDEKKGLKVLGAALAGAALFNAAENQYRVFTTEKEERKERKERKEQRAQQGGQPR